MNLLPFEPLQIPLVDITQGSNSPIAVVLNFRDCVFHGVSTAEVYKTV